MQINWWLGYTFLGVSRNVSGSYITTNYYSYGI